MRLSDFILDASSGLYIGDAEIKQFGYLDGSERYLYEALTSTHDLSLHSPEVMERMFNVQKTVIGLLSYSGYRV